ncbi:T9SS C-terminal target domain-containing protein [Mucilaginibacter mali]|uniref:T9SS C-terminal target domain-containing protein n=1 Tax=Mucilaginibacter mali TaxID=2740462 RepID=A0A7D4TXV7_9SPHI|nr:T9SS C-terminal target domain-containing protein [Mucilaginibacter mali]QKJ30717.1 T9SS C-terminal target domain-containing protein [Mucilaginibacter mali]
MKTYFSLGVLVAGLLCPAILLAQVPVLKVDLNTADRQRAEVNELGYAAWPVKPGDSDMMKLKGVTITFTKKGGSGRLASGYYKTAVQAPYYARLAGDGLILDGGAGSAIEMRISGLPAGEHTLLTYHNSLKGGNTQPGAINISVNGQQQVSNLQPTQRVHENSDSQTAFLHLSAQAGKDVVILFESAATSADHGIVINGFELNTGNIKEMARLPLPKNGDEHADADNGTLGLKWTAAPQAAAHDVYLGTDSTAVATATHTSPLFKGNVKTTGYNATGIYSMLTYYWRVDEIAADGKVSKGNVWYFRPRQLAFVGAEGYGRFARGGRGGKVVEVINLNDDGPGSFREAVTKDIGPRTIVFAVSGIIKLKSRLTLHEKYVTIAGQTAPGKGICIAGAPVGIVNDDDMVRFLRVRIGAGTTYDGMGLTGADNSIVDHCSISWSIDEGFSSRGAHNITLQRTMIAEALNVAGHDHYEVGKAHGFAGSIGGEVGSFHHNLLAHCAGRNWSLAGGADGDGNYLGKMDIRNNVVYNWDHRATDGGAREVNFVGNYYKPGASTTFFWALNAQHEGYGGGMQRYYFAGNVMPGHFDLSNEADGRKETGKVSYQTYLDKPFFEPYVTTQSAEDAYKDVLSDVGCNQPTFDDHDIRIVNETLKGTYTYKGSKTGKAGLPDNQQDVGGWENYPETHRDASFDTDHDGLPDWWEKLHNTNPKSAEGDFSDANADTDHDGFTALDDYLGWMANTHFEAQAGKPLSIDLKTLSRGYTKKCVYQTDKVVNGEVAVKNGVVSFTPAKAGLASFSFTVTDGDKSTFTRQINILVQ